MGRTSRQPSGAHRAADWADRRKPRWAGSNWLCGRLAILRAEPSGGRDEAAKQSQGLLRTLGGRLLQPVAPLLHLQRPCFAAMTAELQLRLNIASACSLAQQLEAKATIAGSAAVATEQPTKTALGSHHALARRLLEQMPGETLGTMGLADTRTVQQPGCHPYRQTHLDTGRRRGLDTNSHGEQQAILRRRALYSFLLPSKDLPKYDEEVLQASQGKSTEVVDNTVDNILSSFPRVDAFWARLELMLFSPEKLLDFHLVRCTHEAHEQDDPDRAGGILPASFIDWTQTRALILLWRRAILGRNQACKGARG